MIMDFPRKRLILPAFLFLLAFFPPRLAAGILTLAWDPNTEDDLAGYKVYYGTRSGEYDFVINVGNVTRCTVRRLEPETLYYLALTAYDISQNESDFSEEVSAVAREGSPSSPSTSSTFVDSDSGGGCFIATAAYGSYLNPHVKILRDFRDAFLIPNPAGKKFVHLYYRFGPCIANHMEKYDSIRFLSRVALLPLIGMSSLSLKTSSSPPLLFPPLCLFLILAVTLRSYLRQTR